ncbi:MAG: LPXTG cell wall anchor domain-containing protein, partial [Ruminococcaceae bacterium]|nr:LPXTG cell wall anchor domain-containing protein [Oscillospiraceae bacterium]
GYHFTGWSPTVADKVTANATYVAQWAANKYVIVFDKNAADAEGTMEDQEMVYDVTEKLNANAFVRAGYVFAGWNTDTLGEGDSYVDEQEVMNLTTEPDIVLYAMWEKLPEIIIPDETPLGPVEPTKPAPVIEIIDSTPLDGSPRTGDENVIFAWVSVLTASGLGFVLLRKKNEDEEI